MKTAAAVTERRRQQFYVSSTYLPQQAKNCPVYMSPQRPSASLLVLLTLHMLWRVSNSSPIVFPIFSPPNSFPNNHSATTHLLVRVATFLAHRKHSHTQTLRRATCNQERISMRSILLHLNCRERERELLWMLHTNSIVGRLHLGGRDEGWNDE